jgi:putative transposase
MQEYDCYYELGSQASQNILRVLDNTWKSFFKNIKGWKLHPEKYLGRPKLPKYKPKDGRQVFILKNIQAAITDGMLRISFKPFGGYSVPTRVTEKLMQIRFVPKGGCYIMEVVYEVEVPEQPTESKRVCSIDLGIDNFATMTNNIGLQPIVVKGGVIKSINQYYNKQKASIQSELMLKNGKRWSKQLDALTLKRNNRIKTWMHTASKRIIQYCLNNQIDTLVVGYNAGWKQEANIGKINNQKFVGIPYDMFVGQLEYKCEDVGMRLVKIEEAYTSGTSFLDGELPIKENYNKCRRIHRGLFKSNNGVLINADVNGAYQIMRKALPNLLSSEGIGGIDCYPVAIRI